MPTSSPAPEAPIQQALDANIINAMMLTAVGAVIVIVIIVLVVSSIRGR